MEERGKKPNDNWLGKAEFYLQGMSMENSLLQNHRMIFAAMEAILFIVWFESGIAKSNEPLVFILGVLGCIFWIAVCRHRGAEVKTWRDKVVEAVEGTEAEDFIKGRFEPERKVTFLRKVRSARLWFNLLLPLSLIIIWSFLLSSCVWIPLWVFLFMCFLLPVLKIVFKIDA